MTGKNKQIQRVYFDIIINSNNADNRGYENIAVNTGSMYINRDNLADITTYNICNYIIEHRDEFIKDDVTNLKLYIPTTIIKNYGITFRFGDKGYYLTISNIHII